MATYEIEFGKLGETYPVPPLTVRTSDPNVLARTVVEHARPHITPVLAELGRPELADCLFRTTSDQTGGEFLHLDLAAGKGIAFLGARINVTPERVQRKRTKGWTKGSAVIVTRPSRFGNPFTLGGAKEWLGAETDEQAREASVMAFRSWVRGSDQWWMGAEAAATRKRLLDGLPELRGRDLACYCPLDQPCHADVLLELANGGKS